MTVRNLIKKWKEFIINKLNKIVQKKRLKQKYYLVQLPKFSSTNNFFSDRFFTTDSLQDPQRSPQFM